MDTQATVVHLDPHKPRRLRGLDEAKPIWLGPTKMKPRQSRLCCILRLLKVPVNDGTRP